MRDCTTCRWKNCPHCGEDRAPCYKYAISIEEVNRVEKENEIEANRMADDAIAKMEEISLTDFEKLVGTLPDRVAKLVLIKLIRKSE